MPDPKIVTISLRSTAPGVIITPAEFALRRNDIDVVRFTNTSNLPGPRPITVDLEVAQAKTLFASVRKSPVAPAAAAAAAVSPAAPASTEVASLTTPRHQVTLQKGESVDWIMPANLPDSADLNLPNAPGPLGGKRRSIKLRTVPAHPNSGDHNDFHIDC